MKQTYDVNPAFLIQPYQRGIRLVKPRTNLDGSLLCVEALNQLAAQTAFSNLENKFLAMNDRCIEVVGANSMKDIIGTTPLTFSQKKFGEEVTANYKSVIASRTTKVVEETGQRSDDLPIQSLSFKLPWYEEKKIIGVFNLSIQVDPASMQNFVLAMSQVLSTGILGSSMPVTRVKQETVYFTKRENEILTYLVKGKTAKEIAKCLFISKRTVEHHIENMKHKSCCDSRFELIDKHSYKFVNDANI